MNKTLGGNIARMRKEKGMTQEELAEQLNISYQAVSKWENGVSSPDITNIKKLAEIFSVSIDELFGLTTAPEKDCVAPVAAKEAETAERKTEPQEQDRIEEKAVNEKAEWDDDTIRIAAFRGDRLLSVDEIKRIPFLSGKVCVNVSGDGNNIFSYFDVNCGTVYGGVTAQGSVNCDNVSGDVGAGGDVNCDNVEGNIIATGDVNCDSVNGYVQAGGDADCGDIGGNISAGGDVQCGTVIGSVSAGGDVECGKVGGSVRAEGDISIA